MNRLTISGFRGLAVLAVGLCLSSCSVSSSQFVDGIRGYSITRGRITRIDNLYTEQFKALSDGVAMTLAEDGCSVTMQFREGEDLTKIFDIGEGVIVVKGYDGDYILESRSDGSPDVMLP